MTSYSWSDLVLDVVVIDMCLKNYNPNQNIRIDGAMGKLRGHLSFSQYLPAKPSKYGIKVWMGADLINGYTNENINLRGTVRCYWKGFPLQHLQKNDVRQQVQFKTAQKGELIACVLMDKKTIYTLSTDDNSANNETTVPHKSPGFVVKQIPA